MKRVFTAVTLVSITCSPVAAADVVSAIPDAQVSYEEVFVVELR